MGVPLLRGRTLRRSRVWIESVGRFVFVTDSSVFTGRSVPAWLTAWGDETAELRRRRRRRRTCHGSRLTRHPVESIIEGDPEPEDARPLVVVEECLVVAKERLR